MTAFAGRARGLASTFFCIAALGASAPAFAQGTWTVTTSMVTSEENATATLLRDGRVLVAGGDPGSIGMPLANAQLFSPLTNGFTRTGNMRSARFGHSATLLANGQVLVTGGGYGTAQAWVIYQTSELFDPNTGVFTLLAGRMATPRMYHTATLLRNGKVLVTGGMNYYYNRIRFGTCTDTAELFDPATGAWSPAGRMSRTRCNHAATVLADGRVLVAGTGTSEIYDPSTNTWSAAVAMTVNRSLTVAATLTDGRALATGADTTAELYDPATNAWTRTGSLATPHAAKDLVVLSTGKVLFAGSASPGNTCELYDPALGTWSAAAPLNQPHGNFPISPLQSGGALVAGGSGNWWYGEVYAP